MTCEGQFEQLSALLDGELQPQEVARIEAHLDECAVCRELEGRLRGLSQDLENQSYPSVGAGADPGVIPVGEILERAQRGPRQQLRKWFEGPLQSPGLRVAIQLLFSFLVTLLTGIGFFALWQLPAYLGPDAVALEAHQFARSFEFVLNFLQARSTLPSAILVTVPALVAALGAWCFGLPAFLRDWLQGANLESRRIHRLAFSLACLAPLASVGALLFLRWDVAALLLASWVATFALLGFFLGWAKGNGALPRVVLEFSFLVLLLGVFEKLAREANRLDNFASMRWILETTVQVGPRWWLGLILSLALSLSILYGGLVGWLPVYRGRSGGGTLATALVGVGALGLVWCGLQVKTLGKRPSQPATVKSQHVFLLAPEPKNRWVAAQQSYSGLLAGPDDPLRARLLACALDWDEPETLRLINELGSSSRGRLPELAGILSMLGEPAGSRLQVSSMKRAEALKDFLGNVHWRGEPETELSLPTGAVAGRLVWPGRQLEGTPIRLIPVKEAEGAVAEALEILKAEAEAGSQRSLEALSLDHRNRFEVLSGDGSFRFEEVQEGAYVLAFLAPQPVALSVDSSLPGAFLVQDKTVELGSITLHQPESEISLELGREKWRRRGGGNFETGSSGPYVRLDDGGVLERFLDLTPYRNRSLRLKTMTGTGTLVWEVKVFSKSGELLQEKADTFDGTMSRLVSLEIPIPAEAGYLQIVYRSRSTPTFLYEARLEVVEVERD